MVCIVIIYINNNKRRQCVIDSLENKSIEAFPRFIVRLHRSQEANRLFVNELFNRRNNVLCGCESGNKQDIKCIKCIKCRLAFDTWLQEICYMLHINCIAYWTDYFTIEIHLNVSNYILFKNNLAQWCYNYIEWNINIDFTIFDLDNDHDIIVIHRWTYDFKYQYQPGHLGSPRTSSLVQFYIYILSGRSGSTNVIRWIWKLKNENRLSRC